MSDALGVSDRDAMHGILRQLVKASVNGQKPDAVNLSFMISMVKSIRPRDSIEAMLVAQMVSVHVMAMRCVHHLANADDVARQDSAARALGRLARTFPVQIEALKRDQSLLEIVKVLTLQLGPRTILVAVTVRLDPKKSVSETRRQLEEITDRIKALDRRISHVLFRFE